MNDLRGESRTLSAGLPGGAWLFALLLILNGVIGAASAVLYYTGQTQFGPIGVVAVFGGPVADAAYAASSALFLVAGVCLMLRMKLTRFVFLAGAVLSFAASFGPMSFVFLRAAIESIGAGDFDFFALAFPVVDLLLSFLVVRWLFGYLSDRVRDGSLR